MKTIVPLRIKRVQDAFWLKKLLLQKKEQIDYIEIWFGAFTLRQQGFLVRFFTEIAPVVGVLRPRHMGGQFLGNVFQKKERIEAFFAMGGELFDVDVREDAELLPLLPKNIQEKLILSVHDYTMVPWVTTLTKNMKKYTPAVYKFAVTPQNSQDIDLFLEKIDNEKLPRVIATTMGKYGAIGRKKIAEKKATWAQFLAPTVMTTTASGQEVLFS